MAFAGMNYLAVLIAAIAAFVIGAIYYGALGKPWMKAARIDPASAQMSPVLFAISFASELVMATMVAGVVGHLGPGEVTLVNGIASAFFLRSATSGSAAVPTATTALIAMQRSPAEPYAAPINASAVNSKSASGSTTA